ncbi:DNA-processing protein DprA [Extensimonas vulgaris]|uniref:DNA protecting protein DprA n=1 Tax=Extensimonas vulgaris TaxID=1031594 RepID=A0A369AIG6_9BURK|nr:DNA-processing protein DprA [Extensimonas vulgaris]RCX09179.1 DNA protecting protein DprA [Extensimonas vulgaris]TWI37762.1 DNA protecting protein DprA [Extensimonas vulgaris]TXD15926.1 DNA-protecting protein DprA [Extensimonas vulgaris]
MEREELAAWLRLSVTPGVGRATARKLLAAFGLPQAVFAQSLQALERCVSPAQARALHTLPEGFEDLCARTWAWLHATDAGPAQAPAHALLSLADAAYPRALLDTEDPPLLLYALGPAEVLQGDPFAQGRCLAMVGSRNPTAQGAENARQFARALHAAGLCIVSGLALGIDAAAHEGALDSAAQAGTQAGPWPATIAVVGTGLDRVYPRRNLELARRIAAQGLIVSEYPLGTPPLAPNFPQRNRIIAGLSLGTLVVEAAPASGSLITARLAAEQGREVFAIPGSIHAPQSRGCHALIRQGAKLVESAQDVLEELRLPARATAATAAAPAARTRPAVTAPPHAPSAAATAGAAEAPDTPLLQALGYDPIGLDALLARTGLDAATLQAQLLELELAGCVARLPGGLFQRIAQA